MFVISWSVFLWCGTFFPVPVSNLHLCFCFSCPFIFFVDIFSEKNVLEQSDKQSRKQNKQKCWKRYLLWCQDKKIHQEFFKTWGQCYKKFTNVCNKLECFSLVWDLFPVPVSNLHLCFCFSCPFIFFVDIFSEKKMCSSSLTNKAENKTNRNVERGTCSDVRTKKFTGNFSKLGANVIKNLQLFVISWSVFLWCGTFLTVPVSNLHLCFCFLVVYSSSLSIFFLKKIVLEQSDKQCRNKTNKMLEKVPALMSGQKISPGIFFNVRPML